MNRRTFLNAAALSPLLLTRPAGAAEPSSVYVAVGYGGRRMLSKDGVAWEAVTEWVEKGGDDSNNLMSVAYGRGRFVAVGGGGWSRETQAGHILVSEDGREWREVKKLPNRVNPVLFDGRRFVAGGPDKKLLFSSDAGETWEEGARVPWESWAFWFRRGAADPKAGRALMIGNADPKQKTHWCLVTEDGGKTAAHFASDLPPVRDVTFGAGKFVAVGPDGLRIASADGRKWEDRAEAPGEKLGRVVWTGAAFLATGDGVGYTSPDGRTWEKVAERVPCSVLHADARVQIGSSWPGQMWHRAPGADGKWAKAAALPPNGINDVASGAVTEGKGR